MHEEPAGEWGELERALAAGPTQRIANLKSHQDDRSPRKAADDIRAIWSDRHRQRQQVHAGPDDNGSRVRLFSQFRSRGRL